MTTLNNKIENFTNTATTVQNNIFNNQESYLAVFNEFLNTNEELKKEFFGMSKEDQDKNFKAILNTIIAEIAINETF